MIQEFDVGNEAYIIESNRIIRKCTIVRKSGDLYIIRFENGGLFNHLLTNTAQIFADVRTYWSPNAIERVTGKKLEGKEIGRAHV